YQMKTSSSGLQTARPACLPCPLSSPSAPRQVRSSAAQTPWRILRLHFPMSLFIKRTLWA
ncbi:Protocadherin Gamma-A5, partial [Manis pentadactyla]